MFHLISLSFLVNDFDFFLSSCAKEERKKKKKNLLFADLPESPDARGVQVRCSQFFCTPPTPTQIHLLLFEEFAYPRLIG